VKLKADENLYRGGKKRINHESKRNRVLRWRQERHFWNETTHNVIAQQVNIPQDNPCSYHKRRNNVKKDWINLPRPKVNPIVI